MRVVKPETVEQSAVHSLGLDETALDFSSVEVLAALLRRCGAFRCPCSPSTLVRESMALLNGLRDDQECRELLPDVLDQLVSYGDFIECMEITRQSQARLLYLAPPGFVEVAPARFLILGIAVDDNQVMPSNVARLLEYSGHARLLRSTDPVQTRLALLGSGLIEISGDDWLRAPTLRCAEDHLRSYASALSEGDRPGSVDELTILDPDTPVRFYRGRWVQPRNHTGSFIARRPQLYGAPLWSYVELVNGELMRLLDLPTHENKWRACDEAWHLQQAIDATRGHPQLYRLRKSARPTDCVLDLFSPIPSWAQRRWDYVGERVASTGSLFAYRFDRRALDAELEFARARMWLGEFQEEGK